MKINNFLKKCILFGLLLLPAIGVYSQDIVFKDGIQQGVINVKFSPTMVATLSQATIITKSNKISTGIKSFDRTVNKFNATNMERIFIETPQNAEKLRKHGLDLWYTVKIDENVDPMDVIASLKSLKEVSMVECIHEKVLPPFSLEKVSLPTMAKNEALPFNDPLLGEQWHYNNTDQLNLPNKARLADINLFEAWKETAGRKDIIVSIHDEGIDVNHEDLKANMWINTKEIPGNKIDDDNNGYIDDINGYNFINRTGSISKDPHGTHVAGTIAAVNNNGIGVSGVAGGTGQGDGVRLMSLKILDDSNISANITNSYIYAADNGAVISQNSWGYKNPDVFEKSVLDAIDYFIAEAGDYVGSPMKGGIVIFAAGNSANSLPYYPSAYKSCLSVASIGPDFAIAGYSNFGSTIGISATGGDQNKHGIKGGVLSTLPYNEYGKYQGTSMACPHVSGVAALVLANSTSQITNTELLEKLLQGVTDIYEYNPTYVGKLGSGLIDAKLAIGKEEGNKAPRFINAPGNIVIVENTTEEVVIGVEDEEDDSFTVEALNSPSFLKGELIGKEFKITLTPKNADIGSYAITLKATDINGNIRNLIITVTVEATNRPPVFMEIEKLEYTIISPEQRFDILDLFFEPDKDALTFDVTVSQSGILDVRKGTGYFTLKPIASGSVDVVVTVDDGKGHIVSGVIEVYIKECLKNVIVQKWNKVLVVDVIKGYKIEAYQWYKNGTPISGANKQYYAAGGDGSEELETDAKYTVKLTSADNEDYSCPHVRTNYKVSLRAYPNPVKKGQVVSIDTEALNLNEAPLTIQVFSLSGQLFNSFSSKDEITPVTMPNTSGYHIIKVNSKEVNKTFKVLVE